MKKNYGLREVYILLPTDNDNIIANTINTLNIKWIPTKLLSH